MAITVTGTGTKLDPYICYSWEDFESLAYIVNIDHEFTNIYTLTLPTTGLNPIPQEQCNIYIKFADYIDPENPGSIGVTVKEIDFNNECIPHTILFKNYNNSFKMLNKLKFQLILYNILILLFRFYF